MPHKAEAYLRVSLKPAALLNLSSPFNFQAACTYTHLKQNNSTARLLSTFELPYATVTLSSRSKAARIRAT